MSQFSVPPGSVTDFVERSFTPSEMADLHGSSDTIVIGLDIGTPSRSATVVTFRDQGDFAACNRAEAMLAACGFSVGREQRGAPRGILHGSFDIQKWRNLNQGERDALHGRLLGAMREGPVAVELYDTTPSEAVTAFCRMATDPTRENEQ